MVIWALVPVSITLVKIAPRRVIIGSAMCKSCGDAAMQKVFLEEYSGVSCIFARLGQINRFALLWKMGREHRGESASMAVMRKAAQK